MHVFICPLCFQVSSMWKKSGGATEWKQREARRGCVTGLWCPPVSLFGARESLVICLHTQYTVTLTWFPPAALSAACWGKQSQIGNSIQNLGVYRENKRLGDLGVVRLDRPSKMPPKT